MLQPVRGNVRPTFTLTGPRLHSFLWGPSTTTDCGQTDVFFFAINLGHAGCFRIVAIKYRENGAWRYD